MLRQIKWIGAEDARLLREQHVSEDPLGKLVYHPKLAEAVPEESERSEA
ncbi:hypothetical protein JOD43_003184 [Pullulanibacillus pueri]|nr:hypothetical protein [Pullulanibacillus pueri]